MAVKKSGQIVLFRFPQTDLAQGKLRRALLLASLPSGRGDWLVCMISSQLTQAVAGVDEVITNSDLDFAQSGLKTRCLLLRNKLACREVIFAFPHRSSAKVYF